MVRGLVSLVINNFIYKNSHHTTYICAGAVADPETLAVARDVNVKLCVFWSSLQVFQI
jgi:hypothetical protein